VALGIEAEFFAERGNSVAVSGAKNWSGKPDPAAGGEAHKKIFVLIRCGAPLINFRHLLK
jgi:hypothetical protein